MPLEVVLWHLIAEWGLTSKTDDWREVLGASLEGLRTAPYRALIRARDDGA